MKKTSLILILALIFSAPLFVSCGDDDEPDDTGTELPEEGGGENKPSGGSDQIVTPKYDIVVDLEGAIDPGLDPGPDLPIVDATFSFNRYPVSVAEFVDLKERFGTTVQGTIALHMMACEMAIHDKKIGEQCLKLVCTESVAKTYKELFIGRLNRPEGQGIAPYHVSAFLRGAHWDTGYNPTLPYTVDMVVNKYLYSSIYQANIIYMDVTYRGNYSGKSDDHSHGALNKARFAVVQTKDPNVIQCGGGKYFMVTSASDFCSNASIRVKSFDSVYNGVAPFNGK